MTDPSPGLSRRELLKGAGKLSVDGAFFATAGGLGFLAGCEDSEGVTQTTPGRSDGPLCHISVGKWMKKEGVGFLSAQQMERCARVSSDVAAKTVELLNAEADIPAVPKPGGGEGLIQGL